MRFLLLITTLIAAGCLSACDAHDYWLLKNTIEVNSEEQVFSSVNDDPIEQDLFVRYQVDYAVSNLSSEKPTEVVVSATSYVNSIERKKGQKVWHLDPAQTGDGILTTSQIELGNSLIVSLECCSESKCTRKEAICPQDVENLPEPSAIADFCYNACDEMDVLECAIQCPTEESCLTACPKPTGDSNADAFIEYSECRNEHCDYGGDISTCYSICKNDPDCYEEKCTITDECLETCVSNRATCFKNCLATWTQCTDAIYKPEDGPIPCELCGQTGLCNTNFSTNEDEATCRKEKEIEQQNPDAPVTLIIDSYCLKTADSNEIVNCNLDCSRYPAACITGCETYYESKEERVSCLERCLQQHLFWCNDFSIPMDYVDSNGQQPCCFEPYCHNSLETVIKTYDVECFTDTSCSTNHYCSSEGVCVSDGSVSNCSASPNTPKSTFPLILLTIAGLAVLRRRKNA